MKPGSPGSFEDWDSIVSNNPTPLNVGQLISLLSEYPPNLQLVVRYDCDCAETPLYHAVVVGDNDGQYVALYGD
jgi:hypothetical protein